MRSTALCAAVALASVVAPTVAHAAPASEPWVARHNLTSGQYQAAFTTFTGAGFRLASVSGYVAAGRVRYAAVWRKGEGPPQTARHGLTAAAYQQAFDQNAKAGWRVVAVNGFAAGSSDRYTAIWEQRTGPPLIARHRLTPSQYQSTFDDLTKQGYRLLHISGYTVGGAPRYATIFEKSTGPSGVTHHALTASQYQAHYTKYAKAGYRLKHVSGYHVSGKDRYAAIWEKVPGPVARARNGIPAARYQRVFDVDRYEGYAPTLVQGFASGSTVRFNTVWQSPFRAQDLATIRGTVGAFLKKADVAGLSVAIAKDGRLLYAAGLGLADRDNKTSLDVHHRLRIGSISKSITAVAVYKIIEEGRLPGGMGRRVFGPGGILSDVPVPASMKPLEDATIGQFLSHTAGLPGQNSGYNVNDPIDCAAGNLNQRIAFELDQHAKASSAMGRPPLLGAPGEREDYSNFSHIVAEAVIERIVKAPYETYVRARVFAPSGIKAPRLFKIGAYDPKRGESKHYTNTGAMHEWPTSLSCESKPPGTGAGGWAMSALDLLRWFVSVDGRPEREILSPISIEDMLTRSTLANGQETGYGRSWILDDRDWCGTTAPITHGHNGGLTGAFSNLFQLDSGYSLAVIGNQTAKTCDAESVGRLVSVLDKIDWPEHDLF
ncbi:serine hydrolase [Paraconexibacter sp.]|uniref:serine hydrolase n=1 Tax=Paraconexibacter sp. TaxID=2949640 RepID=UPI003562FDDE